jgi:hypothetical protein
VGFVLMAKARLKLGENVNFIMEINDMLEKSSMTRKKML